MISTIKKKLINGTPILIKHNKEKIFYVLITLFISLSRFIKAFVNMKYLSLTELGIITLISTVMGLFSISQIGLLNGGYRIFSVDNPNKWKVNDTIYSYFFVLGLLILFGIITTYFINKITLYQFAFALAGVFFGLLSVLNIWNQNILISQQRLKEINKYELVSTFASFVFLISIPFLKLYGALLVMFSKALIFYLLVVINNRTFLPRSFTLNFKYIKWILSFGFLPFLAGVVYRMNMQIQNWSIFSFLSVKALGEFYLAGLFITLFMIVPAAVNRLFFPKTMKFFVKGDFIDVKRKILNYFLVNLAYSISVIIVVWLFMNIVVSTVIPNHLEATPYIWMLLPGLIISILIQPIGLLFNAAVKLYPFLWSSLAGLFVTSLMLLSLGFMGNLNLSYVAIVMSISMITTSFILLSIYLWKKKSIWNVNKAAEQVLK